MQPLQAFTKATAACGWQQAAPPNVCLQGAQPKVAWGHRGIHCRVGAPAVTQRRSAARPWKGCRSIGALMLRAQLSGAQQVLTELGLSQASAQTWLLPPTTCHPLPPRTRPGGTGVRGRAQGRSVCACAGPHGTAPWQALRPLQGVAARPGGRGSRWWHLLPTAGRAKVAVRCKPPQCASHRGWGFASSCLPGGHFAPHGLRLHGTHVPARVPAGSPVMARHQQWHMPHGGPPGGLRRPRIGRHAASVAKGAATSAKASPGIAR